MACFVDEVKVSSTFLSFFSHFKAAWLSLGKYNSLCLNKPCPICQKTVVSENPEVKLTMCGTNQKND